MSEEGDVADAVEIIHEVSAAYEETTEQVSLKLPHSLFTRLCQTFVLSVSDPQIRPADEDGKVNLPQELHQQFLSGFTFSRYMIALKLLIVSRLVFDCCSETKTKPRSKLRHSLAGAFAGERS
jgi:hypothetical protein